MAQMKVTLIKYDVTTIGGRQFNDLRWSHEHTWRHGRNPRWRQNTTILPVT